MRAGRYGDDSGIHSSRQFARIGEGDAAMRRGSFFGARSIDIDDGSEFRALRFPRHAAMVAAELPRSHYRQLDFRHSNKRSQEAGVRRQKAGARIAPASSFVPYSFRRQAIRTPVF